MIDKISLRDLRHTLQHHDKSTSNSIVSNSFDNVPVHDLEELDKMLVSGDLLTNVICIL